MFWQVKWKRLAFYWIQLIELVGMLILKLQMSVRLWLLVSFKFQLFFDAPIWRIFSNIFFFVVNTANSIIATDKRRLDGDLRGMQQELDDLMNQMKNSEEKTKKALSDAG